MPRPLPSGCAPERRSVPLRRSPFLRSDVNPALATSPCKHLLSIVPDTPQNTCRHENHFHRDPPFHHPDPLRVSTLGCKPCHCDFSLQTPAVNRARYAAKYVPP